MSNCLSKIKPVHVLVVISLLLTATIQAASTSTFNSSSQIEDATRNRVVELAESNGHLESRPFTTQSILNSSFIGGSGYEEAFAVAVDSEGSMYLAGTTTSEDFQFKNAFDATHNGGVDCFVLKLSSDMDDLLYSTFIGGSGFDEVTGLVVDETGAAYVVGNTRSDDFPTVNAYDNEYNGTEDGFLLKLSPSGNSLVYSTFVGGSDLDKVTGIAVDSDGYAYVVGYSRSDDVLVMNAYDDSFNGEYDAFAMKYNLDGTQLLYSTYIGGSRLDHATDASVDPTGCLFITGITGSDDFPLTGAIDGNLEGSGDGFVLKLSSDGGLLEFSTFLGGSEADVPERIFVDSVGSAYLTGMTESPDFHSVNAFDSSHNGGNDCFITKLSGDGLLVYSTFLGGTSHEKGLSVWVDNNGCACVTGETQSTDFPLANAEDSRPNGNRDVFVVKLSAEGNSLLFGTYVGGSDYDYSHAIAERSGVLYVAGTTDSGDFPVSDGFDESKDGLRDAFLLVIYPSGPTTTTGFQTDDTFIDFLISIVTSLEGIVIISLVILIVAVSRRKG